MRWMVLAATLLLGGCNLVTTRSPMFPAPGAPTIALTLRPGIWAQATPDCARRSRSRPETCYLLVAPDGVRETVDGELGTLQPMPAFFAGRPIIGQMLSVSDDGQRSYSYIAIEPIERNETGEATAVRAWAVYCGPPHRNRNRPGHRPVSTRRAFPGVILLSGQGCTADSAATVQGAAAASMSLYPPVELRWVGTAFGR